MVASVAPDPKVGVIRKGAYGAVEGLVARGQGRGRGRGVGNDLILADGHHGAAHRHPVHFEESVEETLAQPAHAGTEFSLIRQGNA